MKIKKFVLETVMWFFAFCAVLFGLWMLISFLDVISHNMEHFDRYGDYAEWNLFSIVKR